MQNYTSSPVQVLVGDLNITTLIIANGINLTQNATAVNQTIVWDGSITIQLSMRWTGESLDNEINPSRWARGKHQIKIYYNGALLITGRIKDYLYDEWKHTATIGFTQLLDLLSYKTPPEDYKAIANSCGVTSIKTIIKSLLEKSGITAYDLSGFPDSVRKFTYSLNSSSSFLTNAIPAPDRVNRSYIELAQETLGERVYWLYHEPDETVAIRHWDKTQPPLFERSIFQVKDPARENSTAIAILENLYRVVGGGEIYDNCADLDGIQGTEYIYGYTSYGSPIDHLAGTGFADGNPSYIRQILEKVVTTIEVNTANQFTVLKTGYRNLLIKDSVGKYYTYTLWKIYETRESKFYDSQGRLYRQISSKDGIAYGEYPNTVYDLVPLALTWITNIQATTIEYFSDPRKSSVFEQTGLPNRNYSDNVIRLRTELNTKKMLNNLVSGSNASQYVFAEAVNEMTVETWLENCYRSSEPTYSYNRRFFRADRYSQIANSQVSNVIGTLLLINDESRSSNDTTPQNWETRSPLCPRVLAKLKAEVIRVYPGADDNLIDKREFEYSAKSITTQTEATALANFFADTNTGRAFGYAFTMPLSDATEWRTNPVPLSKAWIYNKSLILERPSLIIDQKGAEIRWIGITVQKLSVAVGEGTPSEVGLNQVVYSFTLDSTTAIGFTQDVFGAKDNPNLDLILVNEFGEVEALDGYVQASQDQNAFACILVSDADDKILVEDLNGTVVTTLNPYRDYWNTILTFNGNVLTNDGKVLTF